MTTTEEQQPEQGERVTRGWLIHALGCAAGIAKREGEHELADYLIEHTLPVLELQGDGLPRGMGAELAVKLQRVLSSGLSALLRAQVVLCKTRALGLELARVHAE